MKRHLTKPQSGLSLIELVLTFALMVTLIVASFSNLNTQSARVDSRSVSLKLQGVLNLAKSEAVRTGEPVAVAFPTNDGSNPWVPECYFLKGRDRGYVERQIAFSEGGKAGVFIGTWNVPTELAFQELEAKDFTEARFESILNNWLPSELADSTAFIFLPSGTMISRSAQLAGDEYPLVVASSLNYGGGTLQSAKDAYTVLLSRTGQSRVQRGVLGGLVPEGIGTPPPSASSLTISQPQNRLPQVHSVEILPAPVDPDFAAAAGVEGVVQAGSVVTFKVEATDPDKGPLFCRWSAAAGQFSLAEETMMDYDPTTNRWVSCWQWRAPRGASVDEVFNFDVTVRDEENNFADFDEDAVEDPSLIIVPEGKLIYANLFNSGSHIRTCDFDGQGLRTVFALAPTGGTGAWTYFNGPSITRDGRRLAFGAYNFNSSDASDNTQLKVMNIDGTEAMELGDPTITYMQPRFTPDGNSIHTYTREGTNIWAYSVFSFQSDGTVVEAPSQYPGRVHGWSDDGTLALVEKGLSITGDLELVICDETGAEVQSLGPDLYGLAWTSRGIFFANNVDWVFGRTDNYHDIYLREPTGATSLIAPATNRFAAIGGNGQFLFYPDDDGLKQRDLITGVERIVVQGPRSPLGNTFRFCDIGTSF